MVAASVVKMVDPLSVSYATAKTAVARAIRSGRKAPQFYVNVLNAHDARNKQFFRDQMLERVGREKAIRARSGGAFGKNQPRW